MRGPLDSFNSADRDITPNSSQFEQSFSDDGGKTWETNWVMTFRRDRD